MYSCIDYVFNQNWSGASTVVFIVFENRVQDTNKLAMGWYRYEVFIFECAFMQQLSNMSIPVQPLITPSLISESTSCIKEKLHILEVLNAISSPPWHPTILSYNGGTDVWSSVTSSSNSQSTLPTLESIPDKLSTAKCKSRVVSVPKLSKLKLSSSLEGGL